MNNFLVRFCVKVKMNIVKHLASNCYLSSKSSIQRFTNVTLTDDKRTRNEFSE